MKILVTGAAGFIGSNLVEGLLKKGHNVIGIDNLSTGDIFNLEGLDFDFWAENITDRRICELACEDIDCIIHHAAFVSVPESIKYPIYVQDVNVNGTLNLLQSAVVKKVKRFIFISSSAVYGNTSGSISESNPIQCLSPYAFSKNIGELYCEMYNKLYNLETIVFRYFNVFGQKQNPDSQYSAVIPKFIKNIIRNERPVIFGDGEQTRDFVHVSDIVNANLKAIQTDSKNCNQIYNVGTGKSININDTLHLICNILGKDFNPIYKNEVPGDIKHSKANIDKIKNLLNYTSKPFKEGLEETIKWYKEILE